MIYNENGIIINEEFILEDYFNSSHINSIINESLKDTKFGKTVSELWGKFIEKVKHAIQWLVNIPNRAQIFANKKRIKDELHNFSKSDNKILSIKLKGEIAKYVGSKGYINGKWIETFKNACSELQNNNDTDINKIKYILYNKCIEEDWFVNEKISTISTFNNTDEIVDFALSVSDLSKPLKQIHNNLLKYNKKLISSDGGLYIEVMNEISHYFTKAMSSIRNLSYACITVCMNVLKHNSSDSIESGEYSNKNKKYTYKKNNIEIEQQNSNKNKEESNQTKKDNNVQELYKAKKDIERKFDNMSDVEIDKLVYDDQKIDNNIKKYADNHTIRSLRYIFLDSLDVDPTFIMYEKGFEYCRNKVPEMFDQHEDEVIIYKSNKEPFIIKNDPSEWNDDYWIKLKRSFKKNYSIKRFEHMKEVAKIVYKDKIVRLHDERRERYKNKYIKELYENNK